MNRLKSFKKIIWVLWLLLVLFVGQTLAVDPYYRPANPVMDFVPQVVTENNLFDYGLKDTPYCEFTDAECKICHVANTDELHHATEAAQQGLCSTCHLDWPDVSSPVRDCKMCHTSDQNTYPEFYQIWGDLGSPHHKTQEAETGQCNACHRSVVEAYSVPPPTTSTSSITPTPASCENCHFWDDPVNPTIHGIGEIETWGPYGDGMHPYKLALGFDPNNLPSRGTHHEIGGNVYPKCWLCHPDEWHTSPYFPGAIRVCENCHTKDQLHSNPEHMQTNNIYTVNGVPNQTVTANEKCSACHGNGTIPMTVCTCILVPDTTEIPRGGTLGFQGTIINDTNKSGTVLFATDVTLPNLNRYPALGYLIGPFEIYLNPYQSKSGYRSHTIPLGAQLGIYTYHGYVGRYGVGKLCECQFEFEVVEQQP